MQAGLLQMVSGVSMPHNLDSAADLLAQAAAQGAELAVLPEYFCLLGQRDSDKLDIAETFGDGPMQNRLSRMAAQHAVWLVAGSLPIAGCATLAWCSTLQASAWPATTKSICSILTMVLSATTKRGCNRPATHRCVLICHRVTAILGASV